MKVLEKLKKKKKTLIIILILIIVIVAILGNIKAKQALLDEDKIETEAIERRTIAQSVSTTGKVTSTNSRDITASLTGYTIATVNVVEGQKVSEGDVICTFDMSSVENNLSNAKSTASISNQQSNLSIESAQRNLNDAISNRDSQIISAQKEVQSAQQNYENVQNQINSINSQITTKQTEIESLTAQLQQLQTTIATLTADDASYVELNNQIVDLQSNISGLTGEITKLQESLPELQRTASRLKSIFDAAVSALNTTTTNADSNVAAMQDNVKNAQLSAQSSSISQSGQLNSYQEQLEKGIVTSTASGTVTSVNVEAGDLYTGTTIASINGIDNFIIEAEIDEYDIADIRTGMKALIKTDSTKDEELEGIVSYVAIAPTSTAIGTSATTSGSVTYKVQISLIQQNERLRLGMNAKISIILNSKENVWTVPYDAVYEREDGTYYIEILKNNNPVGDDATIDSNAEIEELNVTKGIEGTYYVEIISTELKEGLEVVLPKQDSTGTSIEDIISGQGANAGV